VLYELALLGVKEDGPFVPRIVQRPCQLLHIVHDAKAAQGIGVFEWAWNCRHGRSHSRLPASSQLQERFRRFSGQMVGNREEGVFGCSVDIVEPLLGNAVLQESFL
jgi:hypothetical protein